MGNLPHGFEIYIVNVRTIRKIGEIIIACQAVIIAVFRQSFGNQNDPYEYFQYKVRQAVIGKSLSQLSGSPHRSFQAVIGNQND